MSEPTTTPTPADSAPADRRARILYRILASALVAVIGLNVYYFYFHDTGHELENTPAPEVRLARLETSGRVGTPIAISDFRGRVLIVDFWATHCPPCRQQLPLVDALPDEFGADRVAVLSINIDGGEPEKRASQIRTFLDELGVQSTVVLDDGRAVSRYGVERIPTLVIVDGDGRVERVVVGTANMDVVRRAIRDALDETAGVS